MKEKFKKLRKLMKELEHLQEQYNDLLCIPCESVADTVKDGSQGYPPRTVTIEGYGCGGYAKSRQRVYDRILRKQRDIQDEILYLEDILDSVEDPETRDILRLQYINGLTQEQIAAEMGYSVITVKRRLREYWKDDTE